MAKNSNTHTKCYHYFPPNEVALIFLSIILSTLATTLNFAYGKKAISTKVFIALLLLVQAISYTMLLRSIYYRLQNTSQSNKIHDDLELLEAIKDLKGDGKKENAQQEVIANNIESIEIKIKNDARLISTPPKQKENGLTQKITDKDYENAIKIIDGLLEEKDRTHKSSLEKLKKRIEILQELNKLEKGSKSAKERSSGIVAFLNRHVNGTVAVCALLQITSIILTVSIPILYKKQIINTLVYFAVILIAYAFFTITTTIFTMNRVVDRGIKRENNKKINKLFSKDDQQKAKNEKNITHLDHAQKLEIGMNFVIDTITRGADIITSFLYSSKLLNSLTYIGITGALQACDFCMVLYAIYDRFSALKLAEEDQQKLHKEGTAQKNVKTSIALMVSIFVITQLLSIAGKLTVPYFYRQEKISTTTYFILTFAAILCGSAVRFIFNINRYVDTEVTDKNHSLVIDKVLEEVSVKSAGNTAEAAL